MPSVLTSSNINDPLVFTYFAEKLDDEIDNGIPTYLTYNGHARLGNDEAKLALALMNYEYLNNELIINIFSSYSKDQLKQFGDFMVVFLCMITDEKLSLNYNKFFINKAIGNYVVSFGNELVKVFKDQTNNSDGIVASFYDRNSIINYHNVNSWVNYYISFVCNVACREHPGSINLLSLEGGNFQEEYYEDINSIYFRSRV
ncbi:MAG: hypothetical protein IKI68_05465 [Clostridia bacterium]|nr:hypothetical protein [Clostridia bacterium]